MASGIRRLYSINDSFIIGNWLLFLIMGDEQSQDRQLASWRLRRADGLSSSPKARRLTHDPTSADALVQLRRKKKTNGPAQANRAEGVPSYLGKDRPFCSTQGFS